MGLFDWFFSRNDAGSDEPARETCADVADRLERCGDRFANAGEFEKQEVAVKAAKAARTAGSIEAALAIEQRLLAETGVAHAKPARQYKAGKATGAKSKPARRGGSRSWRNNNPGYLRYDKDSMRYGATGADDDGYAIFEDRIDGLRALCSWLIHHSNAGTVEEALQQTLPAEAGADATAQILGALQMAPDQSLKDLSDEQLQSVAEAFAAHGDASTGEVVEDVSAFSAAEASSEPSGSDDPDLSDAAEAAPSDDS